MAQSNKIGVGPQLWMGVMSDAYWYPSNSRLADLQHSLSALNQQMLRSAYTTNGEFVPLVLKALAQSKAVSGFPQYQIDRWIWVALQFHQAKDTGVLDAARGALTFVTKLLARNYITDADAKDINWILDSTVHLITDKLGVQPSWIANDVSTVLSELDSNDSQQNFDAAGIKETLAARIEEFKVLSASPTFETILGKLDALFEAAEAGDLNKNLARKVLLALANKYAKDGELVGPLNIMRDVHVVEAAYALVAHRTRHLPLLTRFLARWPFVSSLPLVGQSVQPLDRYGQYIACLCLHSLFDRKSSLLVVRNNGVHCIIAAVMAAIETMRRETDFTNLGISGWGSGQAITISDGTNTFKATFLRTLEISGKKKFLLGVRGNGSISVDDSILPFIATATESHKLLSPGNDILVWLKRRHPDPLIFMTGSSRRRLMQQECILLLSAKSKFDEYITSVRPLNTSPAALFGLTYVSNQHEFENLSGTAVETSRIYVCSDVNVAADLIREPPEHVGAWRVIVDGARAGAALFAAFPNLSESNAQSISVIGELHERESCSEIINGGIAALFLEESHVEAPPASILSMSRPQDSASRMLFCQRNHSAVSIEFHSVNDAFLEDLSLQLRSRERNGHHSETTMLDLQLSEFLKRATSRPVGSETARNSLRSMAQSILAQASVDRQYDQGAEKIFALFKTYPGVAGDVVDRGDALKKISKSVRHSESVAVLCRSESIAKECFQALPRDSELRRFEWLGIQRLRRAAPLDRIIVVGWLDRFSMRELNNNGYSSHLDYILLPFEREWFNSTINANRRFERKLDTAGGKLLADLEAKLDVQPGKEDAKTAPSDESDEAVAVDIVYERDITDFERIEARALDAMLRMVAQPKVGQVTATAQLVIFEETGSFAYLPPAGRVIVLPGQGASLDEGKLAAGLAEQLLFRSVGDLSPGMVLALPVETDRDLVDARADQFLLDPSRVRAAAAMWKDAIRRYIGGDPRGHVRFAKSLSEAGRSREPSTVRSWVSHSATVAPSNYRELIPIIAKLTNDVELNTRCVEVMQSVDQIYRAKSRAADAIVRELFSGAIDTEQDELSFDFDGHKLRYQLRHVKSLAGIRNVPVEVIGKSASVVGTGTPFAVAIRSDIAIDSEAGTTLFAASVPAEFPSTDLSTTEPFEPLGETGPEAEIENHSLEAVRSHAMEGSAVGTTLTTAAVSAPTDPRSNDLATTEPSEPLGETGSEAEIENPYLEAALSHAAQGSAVGTTLTTAAVSPTDLPSNGLATTEPSEPLGETGPEAEIENHSLEVVRSHAMEGSAVGTTLTTAAVSAPTDPRSIDQITAKSAFQSETEGSETTVTRDTPVSDRTLISDAVNVKVVTATPSYRVAGIDVRINFDAPASLRKWPSLRNVPIPNKKPYLLMDDTLEGCIRKFVSMSPSQQHLYEIHTSPQPPFVTAVMSSDHVVQLARLRDCMLTALTSEPIIDKTLALNNDFANAAVAISANERVRPRLAATGEPVVEIANGQSIHRGANASNNSADVTVAGHGPESVVSVLSDTSGSATSPSTTKSQPAQPERSVWR